MIFKKNKPALSEDKQFRFWIFLMLSDLAVCMMLLDIFLYICFSVTE